MVASAATIFCASLGPPSGVASYYELLWCAGWLAVCASSKKAAQLGFSPCVQLQKAGSCSTEYELAGWVDAGGKGTNYIPGSSLPHRRGSLGESAQQQPQQQLAARQK